MEGRMAQHKKILVADDDEAIQFCIEDISRQEGWSLSFASNGEECLEKIAEEKPCLLILDQRMPRMTGEEVLSHLEEQEKSPPVILISAEKDLARLRRFPFIVRVLTKPFDLEDFVNVVNEQLALV
jgi:two-component system response regulator (stage 0 sporulation protein F)